MIAGDHYYYLRRYATLHRKYADLRVSLEKL